MSVSRIPIPGYEDCVVSLHLEPKERSRNSALFKPKSVTNEYKNRACVHFYALRSDFSSKAFSVYYRKKLINPTDET